MAPPWSRPLDVDRLADGGAEVEFAVPLAELDGLSALRAGVAGRVAGHARFTRVQDFAAAELAVRGVATLVCQRCMQPMSVPIDTVVRVALIGSEADATRVPAELEPVLAPGGRISIGELITEELLLTLPIVPLHGDSEPCAAPPAVAAAEERRPETQRPFARLAELLKR
jgi:DUF177 domain-containing protein